MMESRKTTSNDVRLIKLNQVLTKEHGAIVFCEESEGFPFTPQRVFYLYDIPAGESRGAHAHKECHQLLVAVSGSFQVEVTDGKSHKTVHLNQPFMGLHIPPGIWAAEKEFSGGAICLVLASHEYDESDYIRSRKSFMDWKYEI